MFNLFKKLFSKKKKLCKNSKGRPWLHISEDDIKNLVEKGLSNVKIAQILKCSEWTIRDRRKSFRI